MTRHRRRPVRAAIASALLPFLAIGAAAAVEPREMLADPALEARAREISRGLRCVVCQNESIDESHADLARDLRRLVRERLAAGDSDGEVTRYVVSRYGDFVLLKPPLKASTYALWFGPLVILAAGAVAVAVYFRRQAAPASAAGAPTGAPPAAASTTPLSAEEERRLARLLDRETDPSRVDEGHRP
jgi:cytochrome c-type biogenesis protein CcmH